jgi:pyruvate, water dikinase
MLKTLRKMINGFRGGDGEPAPARDDESLRRAFKLRYMQFRRLLNANDKALKTMAEMETVLSGDKPFGMSFIRSRCALLFVNVYQIIQQLDTLSGGRHQALYDTFGRLQQAITPLLESVPRSGDTPLVLDLADIDRRHAESAASRWPVWGISPRNYMWLCRPDL